MWCENLKNGKIRYVERCHDPITEKEFKVSVSMEKDTAANRKRAQIALQAKIEEKLKNYSVTPKKEKITLSELAKLYFCELEKTVKQSTFCRNKIAVNKIIGYLGKESIVDNLTAAYVKTRLYTGTNRAGTKNERLKRLKAFIRWGYEADYIEDISWINKLKLFEDKEKKKKLEDKYLESDELKLVLDNMTIDKWRFLAEFTALSGLRFGEAIALNTSDIHFEEGYINVDKTYDYINGVITSPKTEDSIREVQMQAQLHSLCKSIKTYMAEERMYMGYRSDLFLSDEDGDHLQYAAYNKYLKSITEKLIGKKVTTHFMRHTHVALMAEQGIPFDVISRRLGHSNSSTTKQIYFHVTKKLKEQDYLMVQNIRII